MSLFLLKLAVVPAFILGVSLAGRRWGPHIAGLLSGFPVVGGPITIFIAVEQGLDFGARAATAGILSLTCLLSFNVTYSWVCRRWSWSVALIASTLVWVMMALLLSRLPNSLPVALVVSVSALVLAPFLFASARPDNQPRRQSRDLLLRMATGVALTLAVTAVAAQLGAVWSGMLAAFPIIGLVLVLFTHINSGPDQVAHLIRGNVQGLYTFVAFFSTLILVWPTGRFWTALILALVAGLATQVLLQAMYWLRKQA